MKRFLRFTPLLLALFISGCRSSKSGSNPQRPGDDSGSKSIDSGTDLGPPKGFTPTPVAQFNDPWAMTFLPDNRLLVTEKAGVLRLMAQDGTLSEISGVPEVDYGGQGGLGDGSKRAMAILAARWLPEPPSTSHTAWPLAR